MSYVSYMGYMNERGKSYVLLFSSVTRRQSCQYIIYICNSCNHTLVHVTHVTNVTNVTVLGGIIF